jgi:glycolate dehydrogenase FAD-linked subunit
MSATDQVVAALGARLGADRVAEGEAINPDDCHDESLHAPGTRPRCVVRPRTTEDVVAVVEVCSEHGVPMVARGSGTGLSGGATPRADGVVIAFDAMAAIKEVDTANQVAVVEPGVTLRSLDEALRGVGLRYPVYPGELSGSIGGNVSTNAGGMRAVRHGVTRHHVLGLELVLADATVVRTGGKVMKSSSGYDLTQLVVGSEGTLALVTEVTLKLSPVLEFAATLLVPFADVDAVTGAVPTLLAAGLSPSILEYLDAVTMVGISRAASLEFGVPDEVAVKAAAWLVVLLETRTEAALDADTESAATLLADLGALDVFVLPPASAKALIEARERAFYVAKAAGTDEIVDVVVPRAAVADYLATVSSLADAHGAFVAGCGHVGDGNVHLSVYLPDSARRTALLDELFAAGVAAGGQVSGEHGIGTDKQRPFLALSDPVLLSLQRRIKAVFDPAGVLNPGKLLDDGRTR